MRGVVFVIAAAAAAAAAYPLSAGCGMWGCDPAQSASVAGGAPAGVPAVRWAAAAAAAGCNATGGYTGSSGCVSTGVGDAVCALPSHCDARAAVGLLRVNGSGGGVSQYAGGGSARCLDGGAALAVNLPLLDAGGDAFTWDAGAVAMVDAHTVPWRFPVFPSRPCPGVLSQVSLTNLSTLVYAIHPLAQLFTYYPNGVPDGAIQLAGNNSGTTVFPPPPPADATAADAADAANWAGTMVPIAPLAVDDGRILLLTRYAAGAPPVAADASTLYLAAVDQRGDIVGRLWWVWQAALPTSGTPLEACMPSTTAPPDAGAGTLTVAGPMVVDAHAAVVALSCRGFVRTLAVSTLTPTVLWVADASLPDDDDAVTSLTGQPAHDGAGTGPAVVWLLSNTTGTLVARSAVNGSVLAATTLTQLAGGTPCATGGGGGGGVLQPASKPLLAAANGTLLIAVAAADAPTGLLAVALGNAAAGAVPQPAWCVPAVLPPPASPAARGTQLAIIASSTSGAPLVLLAGPAHVVAVG